MIPFQLGFLNLIGILVPGAVLALVIFTCLEILFPGMRQAIATEPGNNAGSLVVGFLLTAYILGSVIRLWSADTVDRLSASLIRIGRDPFEGRKGDVERHLNELLECVAEPDPLDNPDEDLAELLKRAWNLCWQKEKDNVEGPDQFDVSDSDPPRKQEQDLIQWAWKSDSFPYPVWKLMELRINHPREVFFFYLKYKRCFATGHGRGKEFFNYCKAVVYEAHGGKRHSLAEEVQRAEAYVRFFAGVLWALLLSALALVLSAMKLVGLRGAAHPFFWFTAGMLGLVVAATVQFARHREHIALFHALNVSAVLLLLASVVSGAFRADLKTAAGMNLVASFMLIVDFVIIADGRFRGLRTKDVDTVFDAFFLVHRHPNECESCRITQSSNSEVNEKS